MKTKITLDEFLEEASNEGFLCTIEPIKNDNTKVKLTPWINDHEGYSCDSAIAISKDLLKMLQ